MTSSKVREISYEVASQYYSIHNHNLLSESLTGEIVSLFLSVEGGAELVYLNSGDWLLSIVEWQDKKIHYI